MDKIVTSIQEINLEDIRFPIIAVFEHPEDYPTKSVGRIFELTKPTDTVIVKDTRLSHIARSICGLHCHRCDDVPYSLFFRR